MSRWTITVKQKALRQATVDAIVAEIRRMRPKLTVTSTREATPNGRGDRLAAEATRLEEVKAAVEELRDELRDWYDNMPENLQGSDKGSEVETCAEELDGLCDEIDLVVSNATAISFPGMY